MGRRTWTEGVGTPDHDAVYSCSSDISTPDADGPAGPKHNDPTAVERLKRIMEVALAVGVSAERPALVRDASRVVFERQSLVTGGRW